jgi:pyruvate formate lyase activating enzyme
MRKEALYWSKGDGSAKCGLCPHRCTLIDGKCGICGVRCESDGKVITRNYGEVSSIAVDPVEKKPLYHYYPGSDVLSIGTVGCNMKCPYCQNWQISQRYDTQTEYYIPEDLILTAQKKRSIGIAYTYSEPIVWIEYVLECARLCRAAHLKNVMVTNGYICEEPLAELLPLIDAWNIDLKTFNDATYRTVHKGDLETVKTTIEKAVHASHVEVTTLIVPGLNDSMDEMRALVDWLASVNDKTPWHISRYFPNFSYNREPTEIQMMIDLYDMAKRKLKYVYLGNIIGHDLKHCTLCPSCGEVLVSRAGYSVSIRALKDGLCSACGAKADFII